MKTWEETIAFIRSEETFKELVRDAYLDADLEKNVNRFYSSEEYKSTKDLITKYVPLRGAVLDLGAGNGISSIAFAMDGLKVMALEPDISETVGAGAIETLKNKRYLDNVEVISAFAEEAKLGNETFDIVYARQSMHHANELTKFIREAYRVLKPGGILITVRDHVINEGDLEAFLKAHPLQKFYGGENAYTLKQYLQAFRAGGFSVKEILKPYDSPINFAPFESKDLEARMKKLTLGIYNDILFKFYLRLLNIRSRNVPGRLYSFICVKGHENSNNRS